MPFESLRNDGINSNVMIYRPSPIFLWPYSLYFTEIKCILCNVTVTVMCLCSRLIGQWCYVCSRTAKSGDPGAQTQCDQRRKDFGQLWTRSPPGPHHHPSHALTGGLFLSTKPSLLASKSAWNGSFSNSNLEFMVNLKPKLVLWTESRCSIKPYA